MVAEFQKQINLQRYVNGKNVVIRWKTLCSDAIAVLPAKNRQSLSIGQNSNGHLCAKCFSVCTQYTLHSLSKKMVFKGRIGNSPTPGLR